MTIENFNKIELIIILGINVFILITTLNSLFFALIFQFKYMLDEKNEYAHKKANEYILTFVALIIFLLLMNLLFPCAFNYIVSFYSNKLK